MLVLAIDTATPRVAAAIGDDGRVKGEVNLASRRRHAEQLFPQLRQPLLSVISSNRGLFRDESHRRGGIRFHRG